MSNGGQASIGQARKLTAVKIPNSRGIDWAAPELQSVHFYPRDAMLARY